MDKTKIEWCDASWNPVTGCLHNCPYCYARRMVQRFQPYKIHDPEMALQKSAIKSGNLHVLDYPWEQESKDGKISKAPYPFGFNPTLHKYRLDVPRRWTRPRTIFVGSMTDLFGEWVPDSWIQAVFDACRAAPWHRYLFLTKNPKRYKSKTLNIHFAEKGFDNFWFGSTVTKPGDPFFNNRLTDRNVFVSVEPILGDISAVGEADVDWIILGAETGERKDKVVPKREWIEKTVQNRRGRIPIFMKDSLIPIIGEENMLREFPWDTKPGGAK